jgi:iron complex outermembrane receptor protein
MSVPARSRKVCNQSVLVVRAFLTNAFFIFVLVASMTIDGRTQQPPNQRPLPELSPAELADIKVTTVSKRPEQLSQAPAAIYVITQEDIRRSGATSIPEALRLAPGVQVDRINASQWAIGIRGFASGLSRSLLVLIDGRSVYSPLFAGTYWDVQDTLLEDIDRIEVIRGPGGTLWGANAVNGVINIITKRAQETQGRLVTATTGNVEQGSGGFRIGGTTASNLSYRFYSKYFDRAPEVSQDGSNFDGWQMGQAGFRTDWASSRGDTFTVQGDLYDGRSGQRTAISQYASPFQEVVQDDAVLSGGNILGRWDRELHPGSDMQFRFYYDRTNRDVSNFQENRDTVDFDFQHTLHPSEKDVLTWGAEYNVSSGTTGGVPTVEFVPARRTDNLFSVFAQDEFTLVSDRLHVTVGSKFEHNDYSGFEAQPTVSIVWTPAHNQTVWASVSRAVRTPSRVEQDLDITSLASINGPIFIRVIGNKNFESEKLVAYQAGYRIQPSSWLSLDLALFLNDHSDLLSVAAGTPFSESVPAPAHTVYPFSLVNGLHGTSHGGELAADLRPLAWWRLKTGYSYLRLQLKPDPGSSDFGTESSTEGSAPHHQLSVQSFLTLPGHVDLDWIVRYSTALPAQNVGANTTADVRLAWRPASQLELAVVGQNLFRPNHLEFSAPPATTLIRRNYYGKVTWLW